MVIFCGSGWREKQKDILQKQSRRRVLQENIWQSIHESTCTAAFFFKKIHDAGVQLYLKEAHA